MKTKSTELSRLISKITFAEGKKSSVKIGDVREILSTLKKLCKCQGELQTVLRYLLK